MAKVLMVLACLEKGGITNSVLDYLEAMDFSGIDLLEIPKITKKQGDKHWCRNIRFTNKA